MKTDSDPIARLFEAARNAGISPCPETPVSLSRNLLREIRCLKPETGDTSTAHAWETLSTAAVSVGTLIAITCTIAGRHDEAGDSAFDEPDRIAVEFIQQSIEP
jgi:hypothetical protein